MLICAEYVRTMRTRCNTTRKYDDTVPYPGHAHLRPVKFEDERGSNRREDRWLSYMLSCGELTFRVVVGVP